MSSATYGRASNLSGTGEIGEKHFTAERGIIEEISAAEGYRFLLHLVAAGGEHHLEGDPERPMFTRAVSAQGR